MGFDVRRIGLDPARQEPDTSAVIVKGMPPARNSPDRGAKVMTGLHERQAATFARNRATGRVDLSVHAADGVSRRGRVHEAGSLRVRFPNGPALEAVTVNSAGGMTGGDQFSFDISVGAGAGLTMTTAAAEKIYRSLGPDTEIDVRLAVSAGGALQWLPQETILFDSARLARSIEVHLDDGAEVLVAEAVVFGRAAMGEVVRCGRLADRWRVRIGGRLVFAENLVLDGNIASILGRRAVAAGGIACATLLRAPGDERIVEAVRALGDDFAGEVGVSAWNGIALARLCAADSAKLRHDMMKIIAAWSGSGVPRLWLN